MAPELSRLGQRPSMRAGDDNFLPIPLTEPALPTKPGTDILPGAGSLLPPVSTEKPALLPVPSAPNAPLVTPPAPSVPGSLPVPPKPVTPAP
jgi:hypothetical protein